jgi:uncharacterized protein (DUF58 family)
MHLAERAYFLVAVAALLAVAGIWSSDAALSWSWMWPVGILLAGLALEAWALARTRIEARLCFSRRLLLGRQVQAEFLLAHRSGRTEVIEYARELPPALSAARIVQRVTIPPGEGARERWVLEPVRLGSSAVQAPPARLLGRLRLAWWSTRIALDQPFSVAPDTLGTALRNVAGNVQGDAARRAVGMGTELFQLRDYVPGDPLSRIDWKASARTRALVARDFTEDQHLEIAVVIDAGRLSRVQAGRLDRLGLYANIAARFAEHAVRLEDRVGVIAYAERVLARSAPERGTLGVRRLRGALERMHADRAEARPVVAAAALQGMLRARSLIVWLCDFADPDTAPELLRAVQLLRAKHFVIVAGVESRELAALTMQEPSSWRDPWIALAARERANAVQAQAAHLRARGALVIGALESKLEAAVLEAYETQRRQRRI